MERARELVTLFRIVAILWLARLGFEIGSLFMYGEQALETLGLLAIGVSLIGFVIYLIWQYIAANHVRDVGDATPISPGWGVGFWFIPIVNAFAPLFVLGDLWNSRYKNGGPMWGWGIVILWWTSFVIFAIFGQAISSGRADATEGLLLFLFGSIVVSAACQIFLMASITYNVGQLYVYESERDGKSRAEIIMERKSG